MNCGESLKVSENEKRLHTSMNNAFESNFEVGIPALRSHLVEPFVKDMKKFGCVHILSISPLNLKNLYIKIEYQIFCQWSWNRMSRTVNLFYKVLNIVGGKNANANGVKSSNSNERG